MKEMKQLNQLHSGYIAVVSEVVFGRSGYSEESRVLLEKMASEGSVSMVMDIFIFFIIHFCLKEKCQINLK
jgi:hypothetical protein